MLAALGQSTDSCMFLGHAPNKKMITVTKINKTALYIIDIFTLGNYFENLLYKLL
jgi:hypothetical protein